MKEVQGENWHSSWQHQNNIQEPIQFCIETCPSSLDDDMSLMTLRRQGLFIWLG